MAVTFFQELWAEYRHVAKLLVGTFAELVAILLMLSGEQWFVVKLGIQSPTPATCGLATFYECLHGFVVDILVVLLFGSFIVVSAVFIYRRSAQQIKSLQIESVKAYSEGLVGAISSLEIGATDQDKLRAIATLLELRQHYPTDRKVNILLGRLYKVRRDYRAAADAMTWALEQKTKHRQATDGDFADLLYNRACYLTLEATTKTPPESENLVGKAYADLERSVALSPANKQEARDERDFQSIRAEQRFTQLIA